MIPDAPPPQDEPTPAAPDAAIDQPAPDPTIEPLADATAAPPAEAVEPPAGGRGRRGSTLLAVAVVLVAVLAGGALFASGYLLGQRQAAQPGTPAADEAAFQPFWDVYAAIRDRFALGPVDRQTLIDGAIKGMVAAVGDPYSTYLTADQFRSTLQGISGQFEGIGVEVGTVDASGAAVDCQTFGPSCRLEIVQPLDGSPAQKAGLKAGDLITKVNGRTVDGLTVDQASNQIRGPKGTTVVLTIERAGGAPFDVTVTRDIVQQKEVVARDLANGTVGYIAITGFSDAAADQFEAALKADLAKGEKKIILDLRGDPGGFVTAARKVAGEFIKSGPVFWEEDAQGNLTATNSDGTGVATDPSIKVVVLIDGGTASASEIVAGALQDTGRGTLVGQQSYGKGTVQTWIDLAQAGGVKLTVAKWLTPDKRWIHKVGLTPDVPVVIPANTPPTDDLTLQKALEVLGTTTALAGTLDRAA